MTESLARSYWPGRSALGGRLRVDDPDLSFAEIVGVVPDVRQNRLDRPAEHGTIFLRHAQAQGLSMTVIVRSSVEATSPASGVRAEVGASDPTASERLIALIQLFFALAAHSLSAVGLYGVLASTGAVVVGRLLERFLYGTSAVDPAHLWHSARYAPGSGAAGLLDSCATRKLNRRGPGPASRLRRQRTEH